MKSNFNHSNNPADYRVGDYIEDRSTKEIGIVQRIKNAAWSGGNLVLVVYLIKKGYVKDITTNLVRLVDTTTDKAKDYVNRSFTQRKPDVPRPADEVNIAKGVPRPEPSPSARIIVKSNIAETKANISLGEEALFEKIKKDLTDTYGFRLTPGTEESVFAHKLLSRTLEEIEFDVGIKNAFSNSSILEKEVDIASYLGKGVIRRSIELKRLERIQKTIRNMYAGKDFNETVQEELDWALKEAKLIGNQTNQLERYEKLVEGLKKALNFNNTKIMGVERERGAGLLSAKRKTVLDRSMALANAVEEQIKVKTKDINSYMEDLHSFHNIARFGGYREYEQYGFEHSINLPPKFRNRIWSDNLGGNYLQHLSNNTSWIIDSKDQAFVPDEIREQSSSYGPEFQHGQHISKYISGDMDLQEFQEFQNAQWEAIQPSERNDIIRMRVYVDEYRKLTKTIPSDQQIALELYGSKDEKAIARLARLRRSIPTVRSSPKTAFTIKRNRILKQLREDPDNLNSLFIHRANNVAFRMKRLNELADNAPTVLIEPVNISERPEFVGVKLFFKDKNASQSVLKAFHQQIEVIEPQIQETLEPELFNITHRTFGGQNYSLNQIVNTLGIASKEGEYYNRDFVLGSKIYKEILRRVNENPLTYNNEERKADAISTLSAEVYKALASSKTRFDTNAIDDKLIKQLATSVINRSGGQVGMLKLLGAPETKIANAMGISAAFTSLEDTLFTTKDGEAVTLLDTMAADFADHIGGRSLFDSPLPQEVYQKAVKRKSSNEVLDVLHTIRVNSPDIDLTNPISIKQYLINNRWKDVEGSKVGQIANEIASIARTMKRLKVGEMFHGKATINKLMKVIPSADQQRNIVDTIKTIVGDQGKYHPLVEDALKMFEVASTGQQRKTALSNLTKVASLYFSNVYGLTDNELMLNENVGTNLMNFALERTAFSDIGSALFKRQNGNPYLQVEDNIRRLFGLVDAFGPHNFETETINGIEHFIVRNDQGKRFGVTRTELDMPFAEGIPHAKSKEQMGIGLEGPKGARIAGTFPIARPLLIRDMDTGIYFTHGSATVEQSINNHIRNLIETNEERLFGQTNLTGNLPIYRIAEDVFTSIESNPFEQVNRIKQVAQNNEEMLFLDIETFGDKYSRLGQVGITKRRLGKGTTQELYDKASNQWLISKGLKPNQIGGSIDESEIIMIIDTSNIINKNPNAKIGIYNENVDLGKMAIIAKRHINRLEQEKHDLMQSLSSNRMNSNQMSRINEIDGLLASMRTAERTLNTANNEKAINFLFLESAASKEGGFSSLGTSAARRGIRVPKDIHKAVRDASLTGKLAEAGLADYLSIDPSKWQQLSLDQLTDKVLFGYPTRLRDVYSQELNLDISNRFMTISGIKTNINPETGNTEYAIVLKDINTNAERTINTSSAIQLQSVIQNLKVTNLTPEQVVQEEERTAHDLFHRRIYQTITGERKGTANFLFEDLDWRFKYAQMDNTRLEKALVDLDKQYEETDDFRVKNIHDWVATYLRDPRIKRQYQENIGWYENQYSKYDKPFFEEIKKRIDSGLIQPDEAELLIKSRFKQVYGFDKEGIKGLFHYRKERAVKPFAEWTVTPETINPYKIRLRTQWHTKRDIEEFVTRSFYNEYKDDRAKGLNILRKALGPNVSDDDVYSFFGEKFAGQFNTENRPGHAYRETLSNYLVSNNFKLKKTLEEGSKLDRVVDLIKASALVPQNQKVDSTTVSSLAEAVRTSMMSDPERQLKMNQNLNREFNGILYYRGIDARGFSSPETTMEGFNKNFFNKLRTRAQVENTIRKERNRLFRENPEELNKFLRLDSLTIPESFRTGRSSVAGLTPEQVIRTREDYGYSQLMRLRMLQEDLTHVEGKRKISEGKKYIARPNILNLYQTKEIDRLLNWNNMDRDLESISVGNLGNARNWKLMHQGKVTTLENVFSGEGRSKISEILNSNVNNPNQFFEAAHKYFGLKEPIIRSPKVPKTPPINVAQNTPIVEDTIRAVNEAVKNAQPKGQSVGRSINLINQSWSKFSGKAEQLGDFISGITPKSTDELGNKINSMLKGKPLIMAGIAALGIGIAASNIGLKRKRPENYEEPIQDEEKHTQINKIPEYIHQKITATIKGKTLRHISESKILNSVHDAIDTHTAHSSDRSHNIQDNREVINKRNAARIAAKLLR